MTTHSLRPNDIAIVGMSGRFPGAEDLGVFWENLCAGVESVAFFGEEELLAAGVSRELLADPGYVRAGSRGEGVELFDAEFFGYTAREAQIMDPQHRWFLEKSWEALEHAGYDPARCSFPIGVFGGTGPNGYLYNVYSNPRLVETMGRSEIFLGNEVNYLANRVSYKLNLRGPSVSLRTACSTSLVAVYLAYQSLRDNECDMALAGGVYIDMNINWDCKLKGVTPNWME